MEREIEALLRRARTVLARHEGVPPGAHSTGSLEAAEVLALAGPVFYELGIASSDPGPIARAALRLQGPDASNRTFRLAVYASSGKLVLATRWLPWETRPLLVRGAGSADAWSAQELEHALERRVVAGIERFELEIGRGEGHLESSGDLLGLGG